MNYQLDAAYLRNAVQSLLTAYVILQTNGGSGGVRSVQVKGPNSGWTGLKNIWGAAWEIARQPQLPLDLHVTADSGQEVQALS